MSSPAGTATRPLLRFEKVRKQFGEFRALDDVSLDVAAGEVVVVIGASGSGKSTLCRCINGGARPGDDGRGAGTPAALTARPTGSPVCALSETEIAMCRLLGVISSASDTLPRHLGADLDAFTGLSKVHCDGWGIAYWDAQDDLVSAKCPEPALGSERFQAAVESARTDAALLHLRKASVNMANTEQNTHPFLAGSVAFAHNGYLSPRSELDRLVAEAGGRPSEGDTDSERYFSLVLAELRHSGPVEALHEAARKIADSAEVVSMNCLLLTHDALYASARYDEKVITAQGADVASYELNYRITPGSVTVASSGWARPAPWLPLANGQILEISRTSLRTSVHVLR